MYAYCILFCAKSFKIGYSFRNKNNGLKSNFGVPLTEATVNNCFCYGHCEQKHGHSRYKITFLNSELHSASKFFKTYRMFHIKILFLNISKTRPSNEFSFTIGSRPKSTISLVISTTS